MTTKRLYYAAGRSAREQLPSGDGLPGLQALPQMTDGNDPGGGVAVCLRLVTCSYYSVSTTTGPISPWSLR